MFPSRLYLRIIHFARIDCLINSFVFVFSVFFGLYNPDLMQQFAWGSRSEANTAAPRFLRSNNNLMRSNSSMIKLVLLGDGKRWGDPFMCIPMTHSFISSLLVLCNYLSILDQDLLFLLLHGGTELGFWGGGLRSPRLWEKLESIGFLRIPCTSNQSHEFQKFFRAPAWKHWLSEFWEFPAQSHEFQIDFLKALDCENCLQIVHQFHTLREWMNSWVFVAVAIIWDQMVDFQVNLIFLGSFHSMEAY